MTTVVDVADEGSRTSHEFVCPMRFADLDSWGHVNNARIVGYVDQVRVDFYLRGQREAGFTGLTDGAVVAHLSVDFRAPLRYLHDGVATTTVVTRIGTTSFATRTTLASDAVEYAVADCVIVMTDARTAGKRPLSDVERAWLARFFVGTE